MTPEVKAFVDSYKKKPLPPITVGEWIKHHNHEIWRKCPKCGNYNDLRKTGHCENCNTELK